jgi:3-isopropylmalate dehydrogenase
MASTLTSSLVHARLTLPSGRARCGRVSLSRKTLTVCQVCKVAVLPGDGIGPEISKVAIKLLRRAGDVEGVDFQFTEALIGGAAIDATGVPLPDETLQICRGSDAVLLAAIGGCVHTSILLVAVTNKTNCLRTCCLNRYKWDQLPPQQRPERGLLALRSGLGTFANLRPAVVHTELAGASTLKPEVVEGVDIMIVRELVGGIYFGEPRVCSIALYIVIDLHLFSRRHLTASCCPHCPMILNRASEPTRTVTKWASTP